MQLDCLGEANGIGWCPRVIYDDDDDDDDDQSLRSGFKPAEGYS